MTTASINEAPYQLEEGHVCIDFVNTAYIQLDPAAAHGYHPTEERLVDLPALGAWVRELGLLPEAETALLTAQPAGADHARLAQLRSGRESLRRLIRSRLLEQPPADDDLAAVNRAFAPVLGQTRLAAIEDGFQHRYALTAAAPDLAFALDHLTWTIAGSTFDLLADPDELDTIRECPGEDCGYLFRDASHGRRRWCSMKSCGNRAKVQRFRNRQKAG
jgi:predicted RNA-binding Zn ribbon-like protein